MVLLLFLFLVLLQDIVRWRLPIPSRIGVRNSYGKYTRRNALLEDVHTLVSLLFFLCIN